MTRRRGPATWTVVNTGPCPTCRRPADVTCRENRHQCADCGTDRGPCDKARPAVHHYQQSMFPETP